MQTDIPLIATCILAPLPSQPLCKTAVLLPPRYIWLNWGIKNWDFGKLTSVSTRASMATSIQRQFSLLGPGSSSTLNLDPLTNIVEFQLEMHRNTSATPQELCWNLRPKEVFKFTVFGDCLWSLHCPFSLV